jgi:hypothetical protein
LNFPSLFALEKAGLLATVDDWNFDANQVNTVCQCIYCFQKFITFHIQAHGLQFLMVHLFQRYNFVESFGLNLDKLIRFAGVAESWYRPNPYEF